MINPPDPFVGQVKITTFIKNSSYNRYLRFFILLDWSLPNLGFLLD